MKPDVFEGNEPYIFVSYAHKDGDAVFQVLNELQARGYRLWYDDGIAPGSEWPEDIARHLDAASMVLAFITPAAMQSTNCRREINFSLSREKPFLSIMLQPTEMPLGMEMQLSAQQMIVRHNFNQWDRFIQKILSCPSIEPCREAPQTPMPEQLTAPAEAPSPAPAQPTSPTLPASQAAGPITAPTPVPDCKQPAATPIAQTAPQSITAQAATPAQPAPEAPSNYAATPQPTPVPCAIPASSPSPGAPAPGDAQNGTATTAPPQQRRKRPVAFIAIAIIAALAIAGFSANHLWSNRSFTTSWGDKIKVDTSAVRFDGKTLTQEDLDNIASLEKLNSLDLSSCDLSGCDFSKVTFASPEIDTVDLANSTGIDDFSFLSSMSPDFVYISGCSAFDDLSVLDPSQLHFLYADDTGVQSLEPLTRAPNLTKLSIADTGVASLEPLANCSQLNELNASNTKITNIESILDLERLVALDLSGCSFDEPDRPLAALSLERVNAANTSISDLDFIADCTILEELDVSDSDLVSLDGLDPQNEATLTSLNLAHTSLYDSDMELVAGCIHLKELNVDGLYLKNLDMCSKLTELERLSAIGCCLTDIEGLSSCAELKSAQLGYNDITSVSAFANHEEIDTNTIIDLTFNKLDSAAELPDGDYRALLLYGNAEDIALTLPEGVKGYEIVVPWCEGIEGSTLANRDGFSEVYIVNCPQNQVLNVNGALGEYRTQLIDEETLVDLLREDTFTFPLGIDNTNLANSIEQLL